MPAILDVANQLAPAGVVNTSTDFTPLPCVPRDLPTCVWAVHVAVPPVAACTFLLQAATTTAGPWQTITTPLVWPAGTVGTKQLLIGLNALLAQYLNRQAGYVRMSVTTAGALTLAGSWLSKDAGSAGLASRSYHLDGVNAF